MKILPAALFILWLCVYYSKWCMVLLVTLVCLHSGLWRRSLPTHALLQQPLTRQGRGHLHRATHRGGPVQHTHLRR